MTPPRTIDFGGCSVLLWPLYLETRWPDGLMVPAAGNDDAESLALAAALGYDSTWELSKHHEISHTLLMTALGYPFSPVLRGVAIRLSGGSKEAYLSPVLSAWEEALVLAFQRYVMRGTIATELGALLALGVDLANLAGRLRRMVRGGAED